MGLNVNFLLPEFHSFVSNFDIIGFQESKTDSLDTLTLPNYKLMCKHRKHVAKKKSGVVSWWLIKANLIDISHMLKAKSKLVLWFKLAHSLTKCGTILCGVVYIPPENSEYAVEKPVR